MEVYTRHRRMLRIRTLPRVLATDSGFCMGAPAVLTSWVFLVPDSARWRGLRLAGTPSFPLRFDLCRSSLRIEAVGSQFERETLEGTMFRRSVSCSFCGRSRAEVGKLVSGPGVYICDRCVAAAAQVVGGQSLGRSQFVVVRSRLTLRILRWLRRTLWRVSRVLTPITVN
jgi:hypothetical protein